MNEQSAIYIKPWIYKVFLLGFFLILTLPLWNLPPWLSPPDWGKTIFFRIILSILIFIFIWQILSQKSRNSQFVDWHKIRRLASYSLAFWLLIAIFLIFFLATIFSLDPRFSLWGSPYRSGGFVNFAFLIFFSILISIVVQEKDWKKILNFTVFIGFIVALVAIFQRYSILSGILISIGSRPMSTIGGSTFLALYLMLAAFIVVSLLLSEPNWLKKFPYIFVFLIYLFGMFLANSQAAFLGLAIGFLYFIFFFPRKIFLIKFIAFLLLIFGIWGIYFLKTNPQNSLNNYSFLRNLSQIEMDKSRLSAWKISFAALQNKPILGYGSENFQIAFDKYYDPSLPRIEKQPYLHSSWWDRAHNFIFDIGLQAGILALSIYLSLFGVLFWQLQRLKRDTNIRIHTNDTNNVIICHGMQATFIAYLVANFFSFDTFSSYLISFLLIGYSLYLITQQKAHQFFNDRSGTTRIQTQNNAENIRANPRNYPRLSASIRKWRVPIVILLFIVLVWFIWNYNVKPFQINTQINIAKYLVEQKKCDLAFSRMDKILAQKSFLDIYLRLKYVDYLKSCEVEHPDKTLEYAQKGVEFLKEKIKDAPYQTRYWLSLGGFSNVLIEKETNPENFENLKKETNQYFQKAFELSPKRQEVFIEWTKFDLVSKEYEKAREKAQTCIDLNPNLGDCWWLKAVAEIFLGNLDEGMKLIKIADAKNYSIGSTASLHQLVKAYSHVKNYQELVLVYQQLIGLKPEEPQYHASLAFTYKELGDFKNARAEAMIVLKLQPEAKEEVEEFLKLLKLK